MSYDLDRFVSDCRASLSRDPGRSGREEVRINLERLLVNPDFVRDYCGDDAPRGLKVLYEDPMLGFQILAHINDEGRVSPPHDHGASWAIYGQATLYTDMIEWRRVDDGADASPAKLEPAKKYRLKPGHAGISRMALSIRSTIRLRPASSASRAPTSTVSTASSSTFRLGK